MRERLLEQVRARLERFSTGQDPRTVLDPEAVAEVTALLDTAPDPAADLEVAHAAGWLRWVRYLALERGEDQQDLDAALALFALVYQTQPDAVPGQVRAYLDKGRLGLSDTPEALADHAITLLREALRTDDRVLLDTAIDLLERVLETTPSEHSDRTGTQSNLGLALRARYEWTGAQADLDAAITVSQAAVDAAPADHPNRASMLSNLGVALQTQFERTGRLADLDSAIIVSRSAANATPVDDPDRAITLSNLGAALHTHCPKLKAD